MAVNVILVSEDAAIRASFQAIVAEAAGVDLTQVLDSSDPLADYLGAHAEVEVVVADAGLAGRPVQDVIREVALNAPTTAVLVVGGREVRLAAMVAAGARGLLVLPLSLQDVQAQLDNAAAWSRSLRDHLGGDGFGRQPERGRLVAVAGAKGGVGCSLLSTAVAVAATRMGQSTCLVDLDSRAGNLGFYCGVAPRRTIADLAELVQDLTIRGIREVAVQVPAGFVLLAAPAEVERADDVSAGLVRQLLGELRRHYDLVVVDCGSGLDDAKAVALEAADDAFLVVGCDLVSIRAARRVFDDWERLVVRGRETVGLVVNRASRRRELQPELVAQLVKTPLAVAVDDAPEETELAVNTARFVAECPRPILEGAVKMLKSRRGQASAPAEPREVAAKQPGGRIGLRRSKKGASLEALAGEGGQSAVELPVFVFVFLLAFLVCAQGVVLGVGHMVAANAANDVARAVSRGATETEYEKVAKDAMLGLAFEVGELTVDRDDDTVEIVVKIPKLYGWMPDGLELAQAKVGYTQERES
ncbi:MAG: AAA family ATPase [Propionibacteriaceae bacterium]|jgi:pilus assembly protein CpaE|nr:AAA family ATPase [Propionibacteriaceae bacterium]